MTISRLRDLLFLWVFLYALWFDKVAEWQLVCATLVYIFVRSSIYVSSKLD